MRISSLAEDQALNNALNAFQITTWKSLAPQVWEIYGFLGSLQQATNDGTNSLTSYPYLVTGTTQNPPGICCSAINWVVWPELASDASPGDRSPVAQATIQQLVNLGVDYHDILGQRSGWQNIPNDDGVIGGLDPDDYTIPPDVITPVTPPVVGAPATLTILSGGEETSQVYTCGNLPPVPILRQSTPASSAFPSPLVVQVQDANGNGVPNATVQYDGSGLYVLGGNNTVLTDSNGFARITLVAYTLVFGNLAGSVSVISPMQDSSYPPCAVTKPFDYEITPAVNSSVGHGLGLQTTLSLTGKSGNAAARIWTIDFQDQTGTATSLTLNTLTLKQTRGATCQPAITSALPTAMTGPDANGNFTAKVTTNFSSCKGLSSFSLTATATDTITLTDGNSYKVPVTGTISNQLP